MRLFVRSIVIVAAASTVLACAADEYPNPPATRDGTESNEPEGPASLPPPSNPSQPPTESADAGSDARAASGDGGGKPLPSGPSSGVDPDKAISSLTSSEKAQLCDWQAGINGGYGRASKCEGGLSTKNPASQAECLNEALPSGCQATVAEVEACLKIDAADPCAFAIFSAPECAPLLACAK